MEKYKKLEFMFSNDIFVLNVVFFNKSIFKNISFNMYS